MPLIKPRILLNYTPYYVLISVFCLRSLFLMGHPMNYPHWDEWDAVIRHFLLKFQNNTLSGADLFAPHNEHRIFFTRVTYLVPYFFSSFRIDFTFARYLGALIQAVNAALIVKFFSPNASSALFSLLIVLIFGMPFGFDNYYWAFQSQFYFVLLFFLLFVRENTKTRPNIWKLLLLSVASFLSMAPGILTCATGILTRSLYFVRFRARRDLFLIIGMSSLLFLFYRFTPHIEQHDHFKPRNLYEMYCNLKPYLKYPSLGKGYSGLLLVLIPFFCLTISIIRSRIFHYKQIVSLHFYIFFYLIALSSAYARGGTIPNRYCDLLNMGWIATFIFLVSLDSKFFRFLQFKIRTFMAGLFFFVISTCGTYYYTLKSARVQRVSYQLSSEKVRIFLSKNKHNTEEANSFLEKNFIYTYPDYLVIHQLLNDAQVQHLLINP